MAVPHRRLCRPGKRAAHVSTDGQPAEGTVGGGTTSRRIEASSGVRSAPKGHVSEDG